MDGLVGKAKKSLYFIFHISIIIHLDFSLGWY